MRRCSRPPGAPLPTTDTATVAADEFLDCSSSARAFSEPPARATQISTREEVDPMAVDEPENVRTRSQSRAADEKRKLQIEVDLRKEGETRRKAESEAQIAKEVEDINSGR